MILPPDYICGFVDGEGCFSIVISKHPQKKLGVDARLHFEIELRADDREILESIKETLGCGHIYDLSYERYGWHPHVELKISSLKDIKDKLIPFFHQHPLRAKKKLAFSKFVEAVKVFENREHLTMSGIEKLKQIRSVMNQYKNQEVRHGAGKPRAGRQETRKVAIPR